MPDAMPPFSSSIPPRQQRMTMLQDPVSSEEPGRPSGDFVPQNLNCTEGTCMVLGSLLCLPFLWCGFYQVEKGQKAVVTHFGKYRSVKGEGLKWNNPIALNKHKIFVGRQSFQLSQSRIVDAIGNPLLVAGTVNYYVSNPEKFVFNVGADASYLRNNAEITLKKIVSRYPYDSPDPKATCLIRESEELSRIMTADLQQLVDVAGIVIDNFYLTDLCYAQEIASVMLMKQRAKSYIEAKDFIGNASVSITKRVIEDVEKETGQMTPAAKQTLLTNLLTVITGETNVQPVLTIGSN